MLGRRFCILGIIAAFGTSVASGGQSTARGGCSWSLSGLNSSDVPAHHLRRVSIMSEMVNGRGSILIYVDDRYYSSNDFGRTWSPENVREGVSLIAQSDQNFVYGYVRNGVIKRSSDAGQTWQVTQSVIEGVPADQLAQKNSARADYVAEFEIIAIHPQNPTTLYATIRFTPPRSTEPNFSPSTFLQGIYISQDGGENWKRFSDKVGLFDAYPHYVALGIAPSDGKIMFVEGQSDILKSADGGLTWNAVGQSSAIGRAKVGMFAFDPRDANIVYIVMDRVAYRSLDGGRTWCALDIGLRDVGNFNSIVVDSSDSNAILLGTDAGLLVSRDQGCHFALLKTP